MRVEPRFKPLPPEPATLLLEGRPEEAVHALRESERVSRRKAKAWVAWHVAQDPMLGVQLETQRRARQRRLFVWFLLVVMLAAGVVYFLWSTGCC